MHSGGGEVHASHRLLGVALWACGKADLWACIAWTT